ncbi:MAG TPA: hypothetical protein VIX91_17845 [Candidatus Acidoferrum sp.]
MKGKAKNVLGAFGERKSEGNARMQERFFPIPEAVDRGGLAIGRFEVTDAQYAEYRRQPRPLGEDVNRPVGGVSLDDAEGYAARLSKLTKETWRLPYEDEVKDLYENRDGENTLDYWAESGRCGAAAREDQTVERDCAAFERSRQLSRTRVKMTKSQFTTWAAT